MAGAHWLVYAIAGAVTEGPGLAPGMWNGTILYISPNTPGHYQIWFVLALWPFWFLAQGARSWQLGETDTLPPGLTQRPHQHIYVYASHLGGTLDGEENGVDLYMHTHGYDQPRRYHVWHSEAIRQHQFWETDAMNLYYHGLYDL